MSSSRFLTILICSDIFLKIRREPNIGECLRVLKTGEIIWVVVRNLEKIVRLYLAALEGAAKGSSSNEGRLFGFEPQQSRFGLILCVS
jgi:hypothetical protein